MNPEKIGKFILKLRKENKLTQAEFADIFGVTYQAVSKWENGKNIPDILILKEICKKYNVDINELLDGQKIKNKKRISIFISLASLIIVIAFIWLIYPDKKENYDFHFKSISSGCDNFTVYGNIAYNSNQMHINVLKIEYYGENDTTEYIRIETILNQSKEDSTINLDSYIKESETPMILSTFLENIRFEIDGFEEDCSNFEQSDLYLQITATDKDGKNVIHLVPLELESCLASHSTTS